jgi:hypothetical protein
MASAVSETPKLLCLNTCSSIGYAAPGWGGLQALEQWPGCCWGQSQRGSWALRLLTRSSLGTLQVGEDVPDARKCACASHVAKVAEFFQVCVRPRLMIEDSYPGPGLYAGGGNGRESGCHLNTAFLRKGVDVIVNASSVEDIDAGAIGQRLSNGLARLSSPVLHRLRLREDENAEPVVSVCLGQAGPAQGPAPSLVSPHPLCGSPGSFSCSLCSC